MNDCLRNTKSDRVDAAARRAGLTLVEVLLAMGLLTVGLLGVAAIFPVGGRYAQLGDLADQGGATAQAALEDAVVRGYLDPKNWIVHQIGGPSGFMRLTTGQSTAANLLGMRRAGVLPSPVANAITRPSREALFATLYGGAIAIDPLGLCGILSGAQSNTEIRDPRLSNPIRSFPAIEPAPPLSFNSPSWNAWIYQGGYWPVRRATVWPLHDTASATSRNLNLSIGAPPNFERHLPPAQAGFTSTDDLALFTPDSGDDPARSRWETYNNGSNVFPSTRQSRGEYSWLFTVAPGKPEAIVDWAAPPYNYPVEVSSVVFHRRAVPTDIASAIESERLVRGQVVSASPGGGELRLTRRVGDAAEGGPFEELRGGQYVMVVAPHPSSTLNKPLLALRWSRVLRIEGDTGSDEVLVALRSSDWPWQPANTTNPNALSNDLRVAILPGVVAVHTKTMRLESPLAWAYD